MLSDVWLKVGIYAIVCGVYSAFLLIRLSIDVSRSQQTSRGWLIATVIFGLLCLVSGLVTGYEDGRVISAPFATGFVLWPLYAQVVACLAFRMEGVRHQGLEFLWFSIFVGMLLIPVTMGIAPHAHSMPICNIAYGAPVAWLAFSTFAVSQCSIWKVKIMGCQKSLSARRRFQAASPSYVVLQDAACLWILSCLAWILIVFSSAFVFSVSPILD